MASDGTLSGTDALISGASSGIGEATAHRLAAEGAAVALVSRRRERLEPLAGELREEGAEAVVIEANVSAPASDDVDLAGGHRPVGGVDREEQLDLA